MKRSLLVLSVLLVARAAVAQTPVPEIPFDGNVDFLKLPEGQHFGEVAGVALGKTGHVFVFTRTGVRSTVHGESAAQLFEFDASGRLLREIGRAHV